MRPFSLLLVASLLLGQALCIVEEEDAVIEFDSEDDLFQMLIAKESTCVHLFTRKDPQFISKRKAFRKAAKRDQDAAIGQKKPSAQVTQWISIDKALLADKARNKSGSTDGEEEYDDEKLMQVFGVHQPVTFYGHLNMKASIEFPISESGDHIVEDAVEALLIEKKKRIQPLLPALNCEQLDVQLSTSEQPTVVFFGNPDLVRGSNSRLSFLRHIHQANLMAFSVEQHNFVAVYDRKCIQQNGHSEKEQDWTLVYYPAAPNSTNTKVKRVEYPSMGGFSDTVHWLDTAYAEDKAEWNKHASICLLNHKMNILILFLDTKSIAKTQRYSQTIATFREAVQNVISSHSLNIIPVIYPIRKVGSFGDEEMRLQDLLGIDPASMQLPSIALIHGQSSDHKIFPHSVLDQDAFTHNLVGYWAVYTTLKADHAFKQSKMTEIRTKLEDDDGLQLMADGEQKDLEFQYNLNRRDVNDIEKILGRAEHAYNFASLESRWNAHMREQGITDSEARMKFLLKAFEEESQKKEQKIEAKSSIEIQIAQWEEELIKQGVSNEQERLSIILKRMQDQEARLNQRKSDAEEQVTAESGQPLNEEL